MIKRILALVAAVTMVLAAMAVRRERDAEPGGRSDRGGDLRVVCASELEAACTAIDGPGLTVTVEPLATTAARVAAAEDLAALDLDAWLTPGPWGEVVDQRRLAAARDALFAASSPIVRSPLVAVVSPERSAALEATCGAQPGWRCVGEAAPKQWAEVGGQPAWGPVKISHPSLDTGVGALVVGAATAGFRGTTDFDRIDLEGDAAYGAWLSGLERSRPTGVSLQTLLVAPASLDVWLTTEAEARTLTRDAARRPRLLYPRPVATADVVLNTVGGVRLGAPLLDRIREALVRDGWRSGGGDTPPLPDASGLPAPGVLDAVRAMAAEATR